MSENEPEPSSPRTAFPPTRWTLVERLADTGDGGRALDELCSIYWYPVYAFLRRDGTDPAEAEDLTQGFFALLLERDSLSAADAAKGKLRTFLLTALKRFRVSEYRRAASRKRGGRAVHIALDAGDAEGRFLDEPSEHETPESLFERRWAMSLLDEAFTATEAEYAGAGKAALFEAIHPFLAGRDPHDPRYAEIGGRLGMSEGAVQVAVHRMRKRYRRQLEAAVAATVGVDGDAEGELAHILTILASG